MTYRTHLLAALISAAVALPAFAGDPLAPDARSTVQLGNPHQSRLTRQQEDDLDRAADLRQQQEIIAWSKLMSGEDSELQPTAGYGLGNPHQQQAQMPTGMSKEY